jgi:hypothetical protein
LWCRTHRLRHDTGPERRRAVGPDDLGPGQPVAVAVVVISHTTDRDDDAQRSAPEPEPAIVVAAAVVVDRVSTGKFRERSGIS